MSEAGLFRTVTDIMASPRLGDFTVEYWCLPEGASGESSLEYGMVGLWLEYPVQIRRIEWDGFIEAIALSSPLNLPITRARITEYVGDSVADAYNGWLPRGIWTAEGGVAWL